MNKIMNELVPNSRANWAKFGPNICIDMRRLDSKMDPMKDPKLTAVWKTSFLSSKRFRFRYVLAV